MNIPVDGLASARTPGMVGLDPPDNPQLPCVFVEQAELTLDQFGQPQLSSSTHRHRPLGEIAQHATIDIAFVDRLMIYHYFHFTELLLTAAAVLFNARPDVKIGTVFVGTQNWCNTDQNNVQRTLIDAVLKAGRIVETFATLDDAKSPALLLVGRFFPMKCRLNKFLEPSMRILPGIFGEVRRRIWDFAGGVPGSGERVLYVRRTGTRTLAAEVEAKLLDMFAPVGIETIDFASLSFADQVRTARDAAFMIGVHGNGLTNSLWMRPGSQVVEFFPADFHTYDYQFFAEIAGLEYFGYEGREEGGYVFTTGARVGSHYGRENAMVDELPWTDLATLVHAVRELSISKNV